MFDKFFVGGDVMSSTDNGVYKPVSRITLLLDDSKAVTAGDDTGREIVANCPYATQEMVDALLASIKGYEYQAYEAGEANIDPAAELGDGVTVGGVYSVIAHIRDNGGGFCSLSAPGEAELEDEFPMDGPVTQMINREIKKVGSFIKKTDEEIRAEVRALEEGIGTKLESYSTRTQTATEIKDAVKGLVNGEELSAEIKAALGSLTLSASSSGGKTTLKLLGGEAELSTKTLSLTVDATNISGRLTIGQMPSNVALDSDIPDISNLVSESDIADFIKASDLGSSGKVVIDGGRIAADSIFADALHLGGMLKVYSSAYGNGTGGYLGYDSGFSGSYGIGIRSADGSQQVVCTNSAARMSSGSAQVICTGNYVQLDAPFMMQFYINGTTVADLTTTGLHPVGQYASLGTPQYQWQDVHAAGTSMSDLLERVTALEKKLEA